MRTWTTVLALLAALTASPALAGDCAQPCALGIEVKAQWQDAERGWLPVSFVDFAPQAWVGSYFNPENPELIVKLLDGCSINGHRWLFAGGITDRPIRVEATDTWSDAAKSYETPAGPFTAIADIEAFECVEPPKPPEPPFAWTDPPQGAFNCADGTWWRNLTVRAGAFFPEGEAEYLVIHRPDVVRPRSIPRDAEFLGDGDRWTATLSRRQATRLAERDDVLVVEPVLPVEPYETVPALSWGLDRIDQRGLPLDDLFTRPNRGEGVHVYVLDTGLDATHSEFAGRVGEGYSSREGTSWEDDHSHGTHVAGTIAGATRGIAPAATVHPVKVLHGGSGTTADIVRGLAWVRDHFEQPAVANMSLGGAASTGVALAVCEVVNRGVPVAVAAGNDSVTACSKTPAAVWQAITTGATNRYDGLSAFSNHGPCVQISAPGERIESAIPGERFGSKSGTSMASPHVAGVVAICLAAGRDPYRCVFEAMTDGAVGGNVPPDTSTGLLYLEP